MSLIKKERERFDKEEPLYEKELKFYEKHEKDLKSHDSKKQLKAAMAILSRHWARERRQ